jgi:EAL domain-containing protein (putative c-di-GMP-specific phosphodiesterase class I)
MSPLLTARPSATVTLRLVAACAVTALVALIVALAGGGTASSAAVPSCLAIGVVCAALVGHLTHASARAVADPRLLWISAGVAVAFASLIASTLASSALFPGGGLVVQDPDAGVGRYVVLHLALVLAGALALLSAPRPGRLLAFGGGGLALLLVTSATAPFDGFVDAGGYTAVTRVAVAAIVLGQLAVAFAWWRRADGMPSWVELCVLALMTLSALDALAYGLASETYSSAWWASLALRAGQFAVPAVGLLLGFVAVADRVRDFEDELLSNLQAERNRAQAQEELVSLDRRRRERVAARIGRLIAGEGLHMAFQPIVDLAGGQVVGAEALARFRDEDGDSIPTERCFLDAHAVDLGVELELAVIELALSCRQRLPDGRYLALNVSPAVLEHPGLVAQIERVERSRPLVVELTEHQPVEDYVGLSAQLDQLRALGVRVAVDDVGSGFSSFRHVTHINPDILKLDRTLVCGIDDDPVRQALASAIVAFARDVGATVVSEGIESESELCCLKGLAVGCGQGFHLARPSLGAIETHVPELSVVA